MIHRGKEGPALKAATKAIRRLRPNDWLLVSANTGKVIEAELRAITGDKPQDFGIEIFEIAGHRIISTPFIPDGEMWACAPIKTPPWVKR